MGILTWGKVPFTEIDIPGISDPSQFVAMAKHWHPLTTLFALHVISYFICVALGSTWFWRWVQPVSDPDCRFLFATANARDLTIAKADDSLPAASFGKNGGCFDIESDPPVEEEYSGSEDEVIDVIDSPTQFAKCLRHAKNKSSKRQKNGGKYIDNCNWIAATTCEVD